MRVIPPIPIQRSHSRDETNEISEKDGDVNGNGESNNLRKNEANKSIICRICEVEIPTVHVEQHSRICLVADRCDLNGMTVNERLERVVEYLERILEYMPDYVSQSHNTFGMEKLNILTEMSCETHALNLSPIALMFSIRRTISEHENYQQINDRKKSSEDKIFTCISLLKEKDGEFTEADTDINIMFMIHKLLDIARSIATVNTNDFSSLEYMPDHLEDLKYTIKDRKVDALVVETFGRRMEKLLKEKYVHLRGQREDKKVESSSTMADEDISIEDDTERSLRASHINLSSKDQTSIEDFEIIKPIGGGAFGRVFLARKKATGDLFAIKVLRKADLIRKNAVESILQERNILISVRHPFVVRFFYSFTSRKNIYLVMEYLNGGDLYSLLRNLGCLDEDVARVYIAELVLALEYLHSISVIHRDLKPDNFLLGPDGHIKLTNFRLSKVGLINSTGDLSSPSFGSSALFEDSEQKNAAQSSLKPEQCQKHSFVGTPDYLAPEILLGMEHGTATDWWSMGVILFELLVGIRPFNAEHPQQIFYNIMNRDIPWPKIPGEMSNEAFDLINKLLNENPIQRLGATGTREIKQHPFFKDINWNALARKAIFIPSAKAHNTSFFMSRNSWTTEYEHVTGGGDFEDMTETSSGSCSSGSCSNIPPKDGDECGNLAEFCSPALEYTFSNFLFKNLPELASINYNLVVKHAMELAEASKL